MEPRFLVDTSVVTRLEHPAVFERLGEGMWRRQVAVTSMTLLEVGFSARSAKEYDTLIASLGEFDAVEIAGADFQRSRDVQRMLAAAGQRGRKVPDLLIAATAERLGLCVLHYDRDFEIIAGVTGQQHEWVVKPGSID